MQMDERSEPGELSEAQLADVAGGADPAAKEAANVTADRVDHIQDILSEIAQQGTTGPKGAQAGRPASAAENDVLNRLGKVVGAFEASHGLEDKNTRPAKGGGGQEAVENRPADWSQIKTLPGTAGGGFGGGGSGGGSGGGVEIVSNKEAKLLAQIETTLASLAAAPRTGGTGGASGGAGGSFGGSRDQIVVTLAQLTDEFTGLQKAGSGGTNPTPYSQVTRG